LLPAEVMIVGVDAPATISVGEPPLEKESSFSVSSTLYIAPALASTFGSIPAFPIATLFSAISPVFFTIFIE